MHVPMAMIPPIRLFGKTPGGSVTRPANIAILIEFEAIISLPVHADLGRCPYCFVVAATVCHRVDWHGLLLLLQLGRLPHIAARKRPVPSPAAMLFGL
jgi:hypothetical protein